MKNTLCGLLKIRGQLGLPTLPWAHTYKLGTAKAQGTYTSKDTLQSFLSKPTVNLAKVPTLQSVNLPYGSNPASSLLI